MIWRASTTANMAVPRDIIMKRVDVVIAIVVRDGKVLICQRPEQGPLGGYWEFPGGKQEPGESHHQCLARELAEELQIEIRPVEPLESIEFDYPHARVRIHPYLCEHAAGEPTPLASQQFLWVKTTDLPAYHFPPANDNLIRWLLAKFGGPEQLLEPA